MSKHLKVGDTVVVTAGNDKGSEGKITKMTETRVVVEGLNIRKKHVKPNQGSKGQIIEVSAPIHRSNVSLSAGGKGVKLKARVTKGGKEIYYKHEGKEVVHRTA